jgi:hypothetical protein
VMSILLLSACARFGAGSPSPSPEGASPSAAASLPASAEPSASASAAASAEASGELGPYSCAFPIEERGEPVHTHLVDVRVGTHDGYDRVVFEFDDGIPEYVLSRAEPPYTEDPSGLPLEVTGEAAWQLVMLGGTRVTPDHEVTYDGPLSFEPGYAKLVHLVEAGDFEAVSTWYIGLSADTCVRVLALDGPDRLVIDIEH